MFALIRLRSTVPPVLEKSNGNGFFAFRCVFSGRDG